MNSQWWRIDTVGRHRSSGSWRLPTKAEPRPTPAQWRHARQLARMADTWAHEEAKKLGVSIGNFWRRSLKLNAFYQQIEELICSR